MKFDDHRMDAARYLYHFTRDEEAARAAGEQFFRRARQSATWGMRDGDWRMAEPPRTTFGRYREFDGWWRECTPAERERLRGTVIRCAVHAPDDDWCGAATPECKQVMRPTSGHRQYHERVIR